ncbi:hypothetical protein, partial [Algoriphagus sp.]|uniref:DMP19 family protein n=1 Tax=Algoriphagus sp. TaxID=1872435 RepID=UPI0025EBE1F3
FSQFFDNGFAYMIPEIIKFFVRVGDNRSTEILKKAAKWNDENQSEEVFFDFSQNSLDDIFFAHSEQSNQLIETYIRTHSELYIRDEEGNIFPDNFSGKISSVDPITNGRKEFEVKENQIHGLLRIFSPEGIISEELNYENGIQLGTQKEYDKEGRLFKTEVIHSQPRKTEISYFYPNGQTEVSLTEDSLGTPVGEHSKWYENGVLEWKYTRDKNGNHTGPYFEYYPNGEKKVELDLREDKHRYINFWDEEGNQLLKDGTGIYYDEYQIGESTYKNEYLFKDFLEDGVQKGYKNGILQSYKEMKNGKPEGYFRNYYTNGKLKEEYLIKDGKVISHQTQPLFENPKLKVELETRVDEKSLILRDYPISEVYPELLNEAEIAEHIVCPSEVFELYGWDKKLRASYLIHINDSGEISGFDFFSADNGYVTKAIEESFPKFKFKPGLKSGRPATSYLVLRVEMWLTESD